MATTPKHTPTPWHWVPTYDKETGRRIAGFYIMSPDRMVIDAAPAASATPAECKAIAALIVRAVNAYEPMREALQHAAAFCAALRHSEVAYAAARHEERIRAAIALAGKE